MKKLITLLIVLLLIGTGSALFYLDKIGSINLFWRPQNPSLATNFPNVSNSKEYQNFEKSAWRDTFTLGQSEEVKKIIKQVNTSSEEDFLQIFSNFTIVASWLGSDRSLVMPIEVITAVEEIKSYARNSQSEISKSVAIDFLVKFVYMGANETMLKQVFSGPLFGDTFLKNDEYDRAMILMLEYGITNTPTTAVVADLFDLYAQEYASLKRNGASDEVLKKSLAKTLIQFYAARTKYLIDIEANNNDIKKSNDPTYRGFEMPITLALVRLGSGLATLEHAGVTINNLGDPIYYFDKAGEIHNEYTSPDIASCITFRKASYIARKYGKAQQAEIQQLLSIYTNKDKERYARGFMPVFYGNASKNRAIFGDIVYNDYINLKTLGELDPNFKAKLIEWGWDKNTWK